MRIRNWLAIGAGALCLAFFGMAAVASAAHASPQRNTDEQMEEPEEEDSDTAGGDAWISAKVKARLMAAADTPGSAISVETMAGVVKLRGSVASRAEAERIAGIARSVRGVKRVDASALSIGSNQGRP